MGQALAPDSGSKGRMRYARSAMTLLRMGTILAVALTFGCATQGSGKVDYDATHDFSGYRTFAWISEYPMKVGPVLSDPRDSLEPRIMLAVRSTLEGKGFVFENQASSADFAVSFTVGSREKSRPDGYPDSRAGGRWSWGTEYHAGAAGYTYTQGVLAIDIFDAAERRPVWHGVAARRIDDEQRQDLQGLIDDVVDSILADFPPR